MYDDEGFEGVEINIPVGSIRVGRGGRGAGESNSDEQYRRVRRRVRRVLGFYRHLTTFISVNLLLLAIDLIFDADDFFVQWVALIWGIILLLHFINVHAFDVLFGTEAERRMIDRELRKRQSSGE